YARGAIFTDSGEIGIRAGNMAIVAARQADCSMSTSGISVTGSIVDFNTGVANSCSGTGIHLQYNATVLAVDCSLDDCTRGINANQGGFIVAHRAKARNCTEYAFSAVTGSTIVAPESDISGYSAATPINQAVFVSDGGKVVAP